MKTKYLLTFRQTEGCVEFAYNEDGLLVEYLLSAELTKKQLVYLLKLLPRDYAELDTLPIQNPDFTITELKGDLSFGRFWEAYGQKIHPHRCEPLWNKLKDGDKLAALNALPAYFKYLQKSGAYKVNPENYIRKQYWKTDWKKAA
jgi:hypothetical protein